jgi:hypothetical protein
MPLSADSDRHLIEVPRSTRMRFPLAQFCGVMRAEPSYPAPSCLVGDLNAAPSRQRFYVSEAQSEARAKPDGVCDYHSGKRRRRQEMGWSAMMVLTVQGGGHPICTAHPFVTKPTEVERLVVLAGGSNQAPVP